MVLIVGNFFKLIRILNKNNKPTIERNANSCQIEMSGIIDLEIKSVVATVVMPINNIVIAKPIRSGFTISAFKELFQKNDAQTTPRV